MVNNDYFLNLAGKVSTIFIGLISSVFSTRYLGVVNKGIYAYVTQLSQIGSIAFDFGICQSYAYNYKSYGQDTKKKYGDICFLLFAVLSVIAAVTAFVSKDTSVTMAALLVPLIVLKNHYSNILLVENMRLRMSLVVFSQVAHAVVCMVLYFCFKSSVLVIVLVNVVIDAFTVFYSVYRLQYMPKIWQVDFDFLKKVLRFGFLPMLSVLLSRINYSVDIFFLKGLCSIEEVAQYSFAATIIDYVWRLPEAFREVLLSKSAKKYDRSAISFSVKLSFSIMFACLIGFAVFGKWLIRVVYGADFLPAYSIVLILILGAFPMALFKLIGAFLITQGKRGAHFATLAVSALVNIAANIYAVPQWGMYGAAWASVISYSVCGIVLTVYFCRLYSFSLRELLMPSKEDIARIKNLIKRK